MRADLLWLRMNCITGEIIGIVMPRILTRRRVICWRLGVNIADCYTPSRW
jgi:hypothetical protein